MNDFAKVYGGALFDLAQEEHLDDAILAQMDVLCAVIKENPDYVRLMDNSSIPKEQRLAMLDVAYIGRLDEYLLNFMKMLCERNAFSQLGTCRDAYIKRYNEFHGIVPATAVSAKPMTEEQVQRLVGALEQKTGKKVQLDVKVDPALRGGLCVKMEGYQYDNTVATKLDHLRRALMPQS